MQNVKNKIQEYLDNKIDLNELNIFFRQNVSFSDNEAIENARLDADIAVVGELTEQDKEDELISESELKENLKEYLKQI